MEGSNPDIRPGGKATDYMSGFPLSFLLRFCVAVAAIGDQVSSDKPKSETSYKLSSTLTLAHDMQVYVPETRKIAPVQPWGYKRPYKALNKSRMFSLEPYLYFYFHALCSSRTRGPCLFRPDLINGFPPTITVFQ